jgi:hypothetical protein
MDLSNVKWCVYVGTNSAGNLRIGRDRQIWGVDSASKMKQVKAGDTILFAHRLTNNNPSAKGFPRVQFADFSATAGELFLAEATTEPFTDRSRVWPGDTLYEHRIRVQFGESAHNVPLHSGQVPPAIADAVRRSAISNGSFEAVDSTREASPSISTAPSTVETAGSVDVLPPSPPQKYRTASGRAIIERVCAHAASQGLHFEFNQVADFYLCLRTKPLVLLAGISGTGKSLLPRIFAEACGFECDLVPVRPDWADPGDLLGYTNVKGNFVPGPLLHFLARCHLEPQRPRFLLLDEMNLARVEHYFADALSVMETRRRAQDGSITTEAMWQQSQHGALQEDQGRNVQLIQALRAQNGRLDIPANATFIGTVNMDETTHPFSRKVLDRAMTIEFADPSLEYVHTQPLAAPTEGFALAAEVLRADALRLADIWQDEEALCKPVISLLETMNRSLRRHGAQVGLRVRDEICLYLWRNRRESLLSATEALDLALLHKVLPRLQGDSDLKETLSSLLNECRRHELSLCVKKLESMQEQQSRTGFTSFWT